MTPHRDNGGTGLARVAVRWQPDSRLVKLVREGHDLAFDEIVRRYRPRLVSYAAAIVPQHQAEDVVQEALTRAHAALARSDGDMNLRPWLHTIVRNGALNSLRDEPVHDHLDENYDGVPQPPDVAARREEFAALTASIGALPDEQRQALVKRELEGRSHEEIGASLGVSPGAVRGLIYRARTTLRDGAGMLIPLPLLRTLLSSGSAAPDATGAATAAAGLAGGGGGIALKAGATLGVAVIAVGSGIAVEHRGGGSAKEPTGAASAPAHPAGVHGAGGPGAVRLADAVLPADRRTGNEGEASASSGPGRDHGGSSGSGSGPGSGGRGSGSGGSGDGGGHSGSGSGTSSSSGSGSGSDDGGGSDSTSGGSGSGDDGGGSTTSGHDGGSSGSGSGDGTSGSGGDGGGTTTSGSGGDDGGSSGSGSGDVTTTTGGSSGSGSGDDGATTTTTTTDGHGGGDGGGTSGGSD